MVVILYMDGKWLQRLHGIASSTRTHPVLSFRHDLAPDVSYPHARQTWLDD